MRLDAPLSVTFSEGMEPRSTGEAAALAPRIDFRQARWSGRTLTLVLERPMLAGRTYTLLVGNTARDRHGNPMRSGRAIVFSTADSFPPGVLEGKLEARGFDAEGTYLWCYAGDRAPDSTARDFDALGLADANGRFRIAGLEVPATYRLWAFADLNRNRSFEPDKDVLAPAETTLALSAAHPVAAGVTLHVVNALAPGKVRGAVIDSTGDSLGVIRVIAVSEADSLRREAVEADEHGSFTLTLLPGAWRVSAFRDRDRNRAWRVDLEPASPVEIVRVAPAEEVTGVTLRLRRVVQGP